MLPQIVFKLCYTFWY